MIRIKTANSIKTSSEIKSYRALKHPVSAPLKAYDSGRMEMGHAMRMEKKDYKIWFQAGLQHGLKKRVLGR